MSAKNENNKNNDNLQIKPTELKKKIDSGGAIIGLELAATMPEVIDFLIVYEAPVIKMLPEGDAEKWRSFVYDIYTKSQREGSLAAQAEFMASLINVPNSPFPTDLNDRLAGNVDFFFKHEFRAFFGYLPNVESIRKNNVHIVTAIGRDSDNAYYVQTTRALAAKLGCKIMQFPGHHDVSFWIPEEFADATRRTIKENKHCHAGSLVDRYKRLEVRHLVEMWGRSAPGSLYSINTKFGRSCVICGCDMPRNGLCMTK